MWQTNTWDRYNIHSYIFRSRYHTTSLKHDFTIDTFISPWRVASVVIAIYRLVRYTQCINRMQIIIVIRCNSKLQLYLYTYVYMYVYIYIHICIRNIYIYRENRRYSREAQVSPTGRRRESSVVLYERPVSRDLMLYASTQVEHLAIQHTSWSQNTGSNPRIKYCTCLLDHILLVSLEFTIFYFTVYHVSHFANMRLSLISPLLHHDLLLFIFFLFFTYSSFFLFCLSSNCHSL